MGLSWIISSNNQIKYEIEKEKPNLLNKVPWYNTAICSKFLGTVFEYFIINARTDRYNLICYITANDRQQPIYVDDEISAGGRTIPKNATTSEIKSLCATLNFIDCWLKHFQNHYQ